MPTPHSNNTSTFRTPQPVNSKKKLKLKDLEAPRSVGGSPRPSMKFPPDGDFDASQHSVLVYEQSSNTHSMSGFTINNVPGKRQGVWKLGYQASVSPTELWMFPTPGAGTGTGTGTGTGDGAQPQETPHDLQGSKHIHGVWGLDPTGFDPGQDIGSIDFTAIDPMHVWFYPPQATSSLPKYFIPRGIWTYPLVKRNITQLSPEEAGFLHVSDSVKKDKLDVGGSWKMLYRRDGLPELPIGPGMNKSSPKKVPKKSPKPQAWTVFVNNATTNIPHHQGNPQLTLDDIWPTKDTLASIQQRIEDQTGFPPAWQTLTLKKVPLTNPSRTVQDCGIADQDVLQLEPMQVHVELPNGNVVPIDIDPNDTIPDLKHKLEQEHDIPIQEQRLAAKGNDNDNEHQELKNHPSQTLKGLGIMPGDSLQLMPMEVLVRDHTHATKNGGRREFTVVTHPTDTVDDLKQSIQDQHGIPQSKQERLEFQGKPLTINKPPAVTKTLREYGIQHGSILDIMPMELQVRLPNNGKLVPLQVDPSDTIPDVKKQLERKYKIPVQEQRLEKEKDGTPLLDLDDKNDSCTLDEWGLQHGDILHMKPMEVTIRDNYNHATQKKPNTPPREFTIETDPNDTVDDLQTKIEEQQGIPKSNQRLVFGTKPLVQETKTMRKYGIQHGALLDLAPPMQIKVQLPNGKVVPVQIDDPNQDTVLDIKRKLEDTFGIPVSDQRLEPQNVGNKNKNKPSWKDPHKTMQELGVQHGDTILMKPMEVSVRDIANGGRTYVIAIPDPGQTLEQLKDKIQDQAGIPKPDQRLVLGTKPLTKDHKSLRSYGIKHGSIVDLTPMEIHIETPNGKKIPIQVAPTDTIANVKAKLEDKEGIPVDEQVLNFNGHELPNASTLQDHGIQHGDTLPLSAAGMKIVVKDWKHKTTRMDVKPTDKLETIRKRLQPIKAMDPEKQILSYKDTYLDDHDKTLADYKIPNGATIELDRFKIYVEVPTIGKFLMEADPLWKLKRITQAVEARFKIKPELQEPSLRGTPLPVKQEDQKTTTFGECGIQHKDTVTVKEQQVPEYEVNIGAWQDPFHYSPGKSPKKKVGIRKKTTYDRSKDYFAESKKETALSVDVWGQTKEQQQQEDEDEEQE